jgi:hypothetical protein
MRLAELHVHLAASSRRDQAMRELAERERLREEFCREMIELERARHNRQQHIVERRQELRAHTMNHLASQT